VCVFDSWINGRTYQPVKTPCLASRELKLVERSGPDGKAPIHGLKYMCVCVFVSFRVLL